MKLFKLFAAVAVLSMFFACGNAKEEKQDQKQDQKVEQKVDVNGLVNLGDYTIHVLDPIYPKPELNMKENIEYLRKENYRVWKELYEKTYGIPLEYTTLDKSKIELIKSNNFLDSALNCFI